MGKLNARQLELIIPFLIAKHGPFCYKCGSSIRELKHKVTVDHLDGNANNNPKDYSNYGLLCSECNRSKYKTPLSGIVSERPMSPEMQRHEISYPKFINLVWHEINENHSCCFQEALYDLSKIAGITPEPARRNIKQQFGKHGLLGPGWGSCDSVLCDGVHIYKKAEIPKLEDTEERPTID